VNALPRALPIQISEPIDAPDWQTLAALRGESRQRGVEGLMLKRLASAYGTGRTTGDWWKWKENPLSVDAVLVMTQPGHGRRAGLHTDHTFALWHEGQLVPVMKAYSGLTDAEMRELDAWIRKHTTGRFGPVRAVEAAQVMELGFEGVQRSPRHRSGMAVRFPRILRWRRDKRPEEADHLERLEAMLPASQPQPAATPERRPLRPKQTARNIDDDNDLFGSSW
jgi:DNA ligase-1